MSFQSWAPFLQISLPIVMAVFIAAWPNNRRLDDLRADLNSLRAQMREELREIRRMLQNLDRRVAVIEERSGPIVRP